MAEKEQTPKHKPAEDSAPKAVFEHKVFTMPEGVFRISEQDEKPVFSFKMGDNMVSLAFPGMMREFGFDEEKGDGKMLSTIAEALNFIKEIHPGDPLPSEVTTGEASWEVQEKHRIIAYQRLTVQLASWITGDEHLVTDNDKLAQLADNPKIKEKVNEAFAEAAENLGFGRDGKEEVVKLIEKLAEELSHIEALRDLFAKVIGIARKIEALRGLYANELATLEIATSISRLMTEAIKQYKGIFDQVDAQTGEIISALRNIDRQTEFIRAQRNDLFRRLMAWDTMFKKWDSLIVKRSQNAEDLMRETHRFLAPRFMHKDDWVLYSQLQKQQAGMMKTAMRW